MPDTAEVTRPVPPSDILQYPKGRPVKPEVMTPMPQPVIYPGEEETDLSVLALKYKNKFKFEKSKELSPEEKLLGRLEGLMSEQGKVVKGAFITIDIDQRGSVTEAETAMVFKTLGVQFEREALKQLLLKLKCRNHLHRVSYMKFVTQLEDGTAQLALGSNGNRALQASLGRSRNQSRMTATSTDNNKNHGEGEVTQPSTEGALALAFRREWRGLCRAFSHSDPTKRGVCKEKDLHRILVSHVSPVPMKELRWLLRAFRRGGSELIDYRAIMTYFAPSDPAGPTDTSTNPAQGGTA